MFKIEGLDSLTRQLEEAQQAIAGLDGDLGTVQFNPNDPASIEQAIQDVEHMVDERVQSYASNPMVASLAEQMKEQYRQGILDKAAEARLGGSEEP